MAIKKTTTKNRAADETADDMADAAAHVEHADHPGGSVTTTDHAAIKAWAESRGGKPASVASTVSGDDVGLIRLEFPGAAQANDSNLTEITWDEFFEKFDEGGLALVYQEQTAAGDTSSFNRLVKRDASAPATVKSGRAGAKKTAAKKTAAKKTTTAKTTVAKKSAAKTAAKKGTTMAKATAKKTSSTAKKAPAAKKTAAKKAPPAAKKTAAKKAAPAAKKTAAKKATSKKVPAARGYRGR